MGVEGRPRLYCNPPGDKAFAAVAQAIYDRPGVTPEKLETELRSRYAKARVRLGGVPDFDVTLYVYRDGRWTGD
jgi:hypothetical protein